MTTTTLAASAKLAGPTARGSHGARINPDTIPALVTAMLATTALVGFSFTLSFAGLSAIALWAAVPESLAPLVPLFIDGAILVYTYSALAARARHESTVRPWTWVALWTAVSAAANGAHAWAYGPGGWQGVVGVVLAVLFPIGSALGTHEIADRMIARPDTAMATGADTTTDAAAAGKTGADGALVMLAVMDTPDTDTTSPSALPPAVDVETLAAVPGAVPVVLATERTPELHHADTATTDTQTDSGHQNAGRTTRTTPRGRIAERHEEIVRLALTTDMSGREIAATTGLDKTGVCRVVREVRAGQTDTARRVKSGQPTLDLRTDAVGSPA
ncbi:DUF2637 domain-containing protein [Cellulosimicrobium cellulans]|uniref:DUF2637 domain-containing protein n=1 Tax=Cellulosimicrobium cellulans TaxID=1710 RepID=UPI00214A633C|nr:DUF2637 domain-containing protein [Cellulosimicrobium cellulans]